MIIFLFTGHISCDDSDDAWMLGMGDSEEETSKNAIVTESDNDVKETSTNDFVTESDNDVKETSTKAFVTESNNDIKETTIGSFSDVPDISIENECDDPFDMFDEKCNTVTVEPPEDKNKCNLGLIREVEKVS